MLTTQTDAEVFLLPCLTLTKASGWLVNWKPRVFVAAHGSEAGTVRTLLWIYLWVAPYIVLLCSS